MSLIKQHSQSLDALLAKNFKQNDYKSLQDTFDFVIKNGGLEEIDFTREEGQSFNPRPARIAQIMIKDCSILSVEAIEASLLASIENSRSEISSQAIKIINSIHIEEKINQFSKALSLALLLDRARHLHLSDKYTDSEFRKRFYNKVSKLLEFSGSSNEKLSTLLRFWLKRDKKKLTYTNAKNNT